VSVPQLPSILHKHIKTATHLRNKAKP